MSARLKPSRLVTHSQMNNRKQLFVRILTGGITAPIVLSAILAVSLFLDTFVAIAGLIAGFCLVLLIVRWANHRDNPLHEVGEIMLRGVEAPDSAWVEELRRKHRDEKEKDLRILRTNAWAVWLFLAAIIVMFVRLVIADL